MNARILMLDIETAPHLVAAWGLFDQQIPIDRLLEPGYTLCWAAKWYGEKEIMFSSILDGRRKMVREVHKLLSECDAVCHYNGLKFDIPTLNKEFLLLDLKPPPPYEQIDLLQTARARFRLASNKLDFVAGQLGLGSKVAHKGFDLWLECMAKQPDAWRTMKRYNKHDVVLLERVYERLLPWVRRHPNISVLMGGVCCPKCGSEKAQARGYHRSLARVYQRFQCTGCGGWFKKPRAEKGEEIRLPVN